MKQLAPLIGFILLTILLLIGLNNSADKEKIPSPLINKPAPEFNLPVLGEANTSKTKQDLLGKPYLLNVWASWCPPCRIEHPAMTALAQSGLIDVYGLNYKDTEENALTWLERMGDAYQMHLVDSVGRISMDFGVYGAPESFLIDAEGQIRFKYVGPMTQDIIEEKLMPALARLDESAE
jgi:cytochrome c biogenesis protein CcmG/thiol:disulfide interchange protein DsbE